MIVPDRPGHGRSPAPGRPDDAEADGSWVAELLEDGAHLVGHSFGGCVAVAAAAKRPSAVRSLTLIEPGMQMIAMRDSRVRRQVLSLLLAKVFPGSAATRTARFGKLMGIPPDIRGGSSPEELERMGRGLAQLRIPSKETIQRQLGDIQTRATRISGAALARGDTLFPRPRKGSHRVGAAFHVTRGACSRSW